MAARLITANLLGQPNPFVIEKQWCHVVYLNTWIIHVGTAFRLTLLTSTSLQSLLFKDKDEMECLWETLVDITPIFLIRKVLIKQ